MEENLKVVQLFEKDIGHIVTLSLPIETTYTGFLSYYEWQKSFREGVKVWGIIKDKKLIAVGALSFYDNNGDLSNFNNSRTAVLTNGQVHPNYRGHGYQKILISERVSFALKNGIYNIASLVKTRNFSAIKNLEKMKFINKGLYNDWTKTTTRFVYKDSFLINVYKIRNYILNFLI